MLRTTHTLISAPFAARLVAPFLAREPRRPDRFAACLDAHAPVKSVICAVDFHASSELRNALEKPHRAALRRGSLLQTHRCRLALARRGRSRAACGGRGLAVAELRARGGPSRLLSSSSRFSRSRSFSRSRFARARLSFCFYFPSK